MTALQTHATIASLPPTLRIPRTRPDPMTTSLQALLAQDLDALTALARGQGVNVPPRPWIDGLATAIADVHRGGAGDDAHFGCGVLEVHEEGFGFLRSPADDYLPGAADIYVSQSQIRRFRLRTGDSVIGRIRPPKDQERYPALLRVEAINGAPPDADVVSFEDLVAVHPTSRLPLSRDRWLRVVDCLAPLGLGARGLIVGPSRSPRSELMRRLAAAFQGEAGLVVQVLLLGERPEEITDWRESVRCDVTATTFDEPPSRHLHVADIVFERARRLAERGSEVLLLVDSFSRLLRFALAAVAQPGHLVDGVEADALHRLRGLLGAGRDLRDAGSITVIGSLNGTEDPLSAALLRDVEESLSWQLHLLDAAPPAGLPFTPDIARSFTRRADRLLPADEHARREQWRQRATQSGSGPSAEAGFDALRQALRHAEGGDGAEVAPPT